MGNHASERPKKTKIRVSKTILIFRDETNYVITLSYLCLVVGLTLLCLYFISIQFLRETDDWLNVSVLASVEGVLQFTPVFYSS